MTRRKFKRAGLNTKLIVDVGLAGIMVDLLPQLVNKFFPIDPTLYSVVGAGGSYIVGSMLKKPDLANAGIALGLVKIVAPIVDDLIGGFTGTQQITPSKSGLPVPIKKVMPVTTVDDYIHLNDYVSNPGVRQGYNAYKDSY